ncbi:MAG TPA: type II toxin-antitoxin system VapC family toxin [bacterium]
MPFLLDTDWAVWFLRGQDQVRTRIESVRREGLGISAVTLAELVTGVHRSRDPKQAAEGLRRFLTGVVVLPFTEEIARRFGEENARLLDGGQVISQFDLTIAATALHHGMVLLSENRKHYQRIPNLKLESLRTNP